jgi:hypothetical protein
MPRLYAFHGSARPGDTTANHLAVTGPETVWQAPGPVAAADVSDGPGTTILLVENDRAGGQAAVRARPISAEASR